MAQETSALTLKEQQTVFQNTQNLAGATKLQKGALLYEIRTILSPREEFTAFLRATMPEKSGWRYIGQWEVALRELPETFLDVVLETGVDLGTITDKLPVGKYTETVQSLGGLPHTRDRKKVVKFIEEMQEAYKKWKGGTRWEGYDPERPSNQSRPTKDRVQAAYFLVREQMSKVPANQRRHALRCLFSYLMKDFNISHMTPRPVNLPEEFKAAGAGA